MACFPAFSQFPSELQNLIWWHACLSSKPKLAIVELVRSPRDHPNEESPRGSSDSSIQFVVRNQPHSSETNSLLAILHATPGSRGTAHLFIAKHIHASLWNQRLGLATVHFQPWKDLLWLRSGDFPSNLAVTLGLVAGGEFSNIMLDAKLFQSNSWVYGVDEPVDLSLRSLRRIGNTAFSRLFKDTDQGLRSPQLPNNLYFLVDAPLKAPFISPFDHRPRHSPRYGDFCRRYEQLDVLPADRVQQWNLTATSIEQREIDSVNSVVDLWAILGVALPNIFFVRIKHASI